MIDLKTILKRLKNPSVLISIASEIVVIFMLFNVGIGVNVVSGTLTAISSILVLLGILSNPDTENKGYGEDTIK